MEIPKAKESQEVVKARQKLERKLKRENRYMTSEALANMARLIELQLARHDEERIDLKSKGIQLFDANRHPAAVKSKFVADLLQNLKEKPTQKTLKGRIRR